MTHAGTANHWQFYLIVGLMGSTIGCAGMRPEASEARLNEALERSDSQPYPTALPKSAVSAHDERPRERVAFARDEENSRESASDSSTATVSKAPLANKPANVPADPPPKPINLQREDPRPIALAQPLNQAPANSQPAKPQPVAVERTTVPPAEVKPVAAEIVTPVETVASPQALLPPELMQQMLPQPASIAPSASPALNALAMTIPTAMLPAAQLTPPPSAVQVPVSTVGSVNVNANAASLTSAADLADLNRRLDELTDVLESEVRRRRTVNEKDEVLPRLEQQLRLMYVLAGRSEPAAEGVDSLPAPEREAYRHLLFGLATWLSEDEATRSAMRNAKVMRSLRESASELSLGSKLDLSHLTFCEKVEYFGWYTEFPRSEFKPKQQVILYVEVDNFAAEEKGPQAFETELQGSYQIFDASGGVVDERKLPLDREVCRNYRRDYFLAYRIYLPAEIPDGGYRLELTIEDLKAKDEFKGRKLGQAMIDFSIRN